ncbi:MAG: ATP-binding cassette domain-containing protein [Thermomicrobiales bacterium]|nr:ATP-binding cassette domain-containing protein [Thermomicrobiales bacterium]
MTAITTRSSGVTMTDVSFRYPGRSDLTLDRVSWRIEPGDFIVVTGPSGGGKSTLLRCLNGLVPHFSGGQFGGEVSVFGIDTRDHGPRHLSSRVGFVFQDPEAQAVTRIVEDDVAFGLEQAGLPRYEMRKRIEEVLDLLGIAELRARDITTLSGGERQRVAIAGAMARRPELLVLDEPTSQLDPWGADEVLTALHRLNDDLGLAIVLAEHRLDRVASSADTIRIVAGDGSMIDRPPAEALALLPVRNQPPLTRFALQAGLGRIPLTIKEARRQTGSLPEPAISFEPRHSAGEPIATLDGVTVVRGRTTVLNDIDLDFRSGQITAIMGRNGAGKSTLIRTTLGMLPCERGGVTVAEKPVAAGKMGELAGIAGYLPQDPARLLFAETVMQELEASIKHLPPGSQRLDPRHLLDELDLGHLAEEHPRDISVGERERVALAAVLISAPRLLMLDEPTRGMDGVRKHRLMRILELARERGTAIVMATHDVELVAEWADRVILLADGAVIADGDPRQVLAGSVTFSPQMNRLFGGGILTVEDALASIPRSDASIP